MKGVEMATVTQERDLEKIQRRQKYWWLFLGGGFLLLGLFVGWLVIQFVTGEMRLFSPEMHGMVLQSPEQMPDFTLTSQTGEPVSLSDFRGQVVLLYFGYTHCPDVGPATLLELRKVKEQLGREGEEVQVIMMTVDPLRDTPEHLGRYLGNFDPSFIGLTGTEEELLAASIPYGVFFQAGEGSVESGYDVDHTGAVEVIDREGYLRVIYPVGVTGAEMGEDLAYLLRQ